MLETIVYNHLLESTPPLGIPGSRSREPLKRLILHSGRDPSELSRFPHEIAFQLIQGREVMLLSDLPMSKPVGHQRWAFQIKDVVTFYWKTGDPTINYLAHAKWSPELQRYWLLHTVLPVYFTLQGSYYILHGGAVEIDGKPILFTAPSNGGKSTMTEYFLQKGHPMISDDKVATSEMAGAIHVVPSYPFHRPYRRVEDLGYPVENFASGNKPLHAIYELEQAAVDSSIDISKLQGMEKFKSLRFSSELNFPFLKKQRFDYLGQMADQVSIFRINVPQDLQRLPEVYDRIIEHTLAL